MNATLPYGAQRPPAPAAAPCPECGRGSVYRYGARGFVKLLAR